MPVRVRLWAPYFKKVMLEFQYFILHNKLCLNLFLIFFIIYLIVELNHLKYYKYIISIVEAVDKTNREKSIFLDIRNNNLYNKGHIIKAININLKKIKKFTNNSMKILNKYKNYSIIIYCNKGHHSIQAYKILKHHGFNKLFILHGGFKKWKNDRILPISYSN